MEEGDDSIVRHKPGTGEDNTLTVLGQVLLNIESEGIDVLLQVDTLCGGSSHGNGGGAVRGHRRRRRETIIAESVRVQATDIIGGMLVRVRVPSHLFEPLLAMDGGRRRRGNGGKDSLKRREESHADLQFSHTSSAG